MPGETTVRVEFLQPPPGVSPLLALSRSTLQDEQRTLPALHAGNEILVFLPWLLLSEQKLIFTPSQTSVTPLLTAGQFGRADREQSTRAPSDGRE